MRQAQRHTVLQVLGPMLLGLGLILSGCGGEIDDTGEGQVRSEVEQAVDRVQRSTDRAQDAAERAEYYLNHGEMPPAEENKEQE